MKRRNFLKGAVALAGFSCLPRIETQSESTNWQSPSVSQPAPQRFIVRGMPMTYGCDGELEPLGKTQHVLFFTEDFIAESLATRGSADRVFITLRSDKGPLDTKIFSTFDLLDYRYPFQLFTPLHFKRGSSLEISVENKSPYFRRYGCFLFGLQELPARNGMCVLNSVRRNAL